MKGRFLLAGAFSRTKSLIQFLSKYRGESELVVYDGVNKCKWNGGRINRDIFYTDGLINYYYSKDIKIALNYAYFFKYARTNVLFKVSSAVSIFCRYYNELFGIS
jgi:hypothetical protein